ANEEDAARDRRAGVVAAIPRQRVIAGRQRALSERANPSAVDVEDLRVDALGSRQLEMDLDVTMRRVGAWGGHRQLPRHRNPSNRAGAADSGQRLRGIV